MSPRQAARRSGPGRGAGPPSLPRKASRPAASGPSAPRRAGRKSRTQAGTSTRAKPPLPPPSLPFSGTARRRQRGSSRRKSMYSPHRWQCPLQYCQSCAPHAGHRKKRRQPTQSRTINARAIRMGARSSGEPSSPKYSRIIQITRPQMRKWNLRHRAGGTRSRSFLTSSPPLSKSKITHYPLTVIFPRRKRGPAFPRREFSHRFSAFQQTVSTE